MEANEIEKYINTWLSLNPQYNQIFKTLRETYPDISSLAARNLIINKITINDLFLLDICAHCGQVYDRAKMITSLTTFADPNPVNFCCIEHIKLYDPLKQIREITKTPQ